MKNAGPGTVLTAVLLLAAPAMPVFAEPPATTLATLIDRAQIEDLLATYYGDFNAAIVAYIGSGTWPSNTGMGAYYLEDGVLEVTGMHVTARGRQQIENFYRKMMVDPKAPPAAGERDYWHYTNPRIAVHGDSATADLLWTVDSATNPKEPLKIAAMGREHDELVKRNGRWYFKHRLVTP